MILWKEGAERPERAVVLKVVGYTAATLAAGAAIVFSIAHYHGRVRPDTLLAAGEIEIKRMTPTMSADSALPPARGRGNAAAHYILALNSYAERRIPYLKNRGFKAFVKEPPVTDWEISELELGARRSICDFYEERAGLPAFTLTKGAKEPWRFRPAKDPEEPRPYYTPLRLLMVGILYQADDRKDEGKWVEAARRYRLVARMGAHLLQRPGCLLDFELGLETQIKALIGLEAAYRKAKKPSHHRVMLYRRTVERLGERFRRKYGQLDNPEAAAMIAARDEDPMWRQEALASLRYQHRYHALGFLERRTIAAAHAQNSTSAGPQRHKPTERIARTQTPPKN